MQSLLWVFVLGCFTLGAIYALGFAIVFAVKRLDSRFKGAIGGVALVSVGLFGLWGLAMAVMDAALPGFEVSFNRSYGPLFQPRPRNQLPPVIWSTEPELFVVLVLIWTAVGLGLVVLGWRKLKRAWSAED